MSPVLAAAIATWAGGPEGWRWAWYLLGIPVAIVAIVSFKMKEPPRGQFEKDDVLGEVFEDENPAPISMESAFARIKKIATIRSVLVAFCALGFGLFSQGELASLYLQRQPARDRPADPRAHPEPLGDRRAAVPAVRRAVLRPDLPHEPREGARDGRAR